MRCAISRKSSTQRNECRKKNTLPKRKFPQEVVVVYTGELRCFVIRFFFFFSLSFFFSFLSQPNRRRVVAIRAWKKFNFFLSIRTVQYFSGVIIIITYVQILITIVTALLTLRMSITNKPRRLLCKSQQYFMLIINFLRR